MLGVPLYDYQVLFLAEEMKMNFKNTPKGIFVVLIRCVYSNNFAAKSGLPIETTTKSLVANNIQISKEYTYNEISGQHQA